MVTAERARESASIAMFIKSYVVPPYYDSLLGKLIISGNSRKDMLATASISAGAVQSCWRHDDASRFMRS